MKMQTFSGEVQINGRTCTVEFKDDGSFDIGCEFDTANEALAFIDKLVDAKEASSKPASGVSKKNGCTTTKAAPKPRPKKPTVNVVALEEVEPEVPEETPPAPKPAAPTDGAVFKLETIRQIVEHLATVEKLETVDDIADRCEAIRADHPGLSKIAPGEFRSRIKRTAALLGIGEEEPPIT